MLQNQLLELLALLESGEYVTAQYLAEALQVSPKTVRLRIKEAAGAVCRHGGEIESKPRHGYRLRLDDPDSFARWRESLGVGRTDSPQTGEERFHYLAAYLLSHDSYIKLDDLSDFIYVSRATLSACLKEVEAFLGQYRIRLERRPGYGIRAVGREFDIRRCLRELFLRQLSMDAAAKKRQERELKELAELILKGLHRFSIHLSEIAFENFVRDIYVAMRRMKIGCYIDFAEEEDRISLDGSERGFVQWLSGQLTGKYGVSYTEGEKYYIALHLAGKRTGGGEENGDGNFIIREEIDRLVLRMLDDVSRSMNLNLKGSLELRMALNQHMAPLDIRLRYDIPLDNPSLDMIRQRYTMAYAVASQAATVLQEFYQKSIPEDEVAYLALIFAVALDEQKQKRQAEKIRILIVCGSGKSSARLLRYRYLQEFGEDIEEIYTCDRYELVQFDFDRVDYILTTVPIDFPVPRPIQEIGLFPGAEDMEKVRRLLKSRRKEFLFNYYRPENFFAGQLGETREEVLRRLCELATAKDDLPDKLYESVMERERMMPTDYGSHVAIPHPSHVMTEDTHVYVAVLAHPVYWSRQEVQVVILTLIGRREDEDLQKYYEATTEWIADEEAVRQLAQSPDYLTFMKLLQRK